jgi:hypothetical protein
MSDDAILNGGGRIGVALEGKYRMIPHQLAGAGDINDMLFVVAVAFVFFDFALFDEKNASWNSALPENKFSFYIFFLTGVLKDPVKVSRRQFCKYKVRIEVPWSMGNKPVKLIFLYKKLK